MSRGSIFIALVLCGLTATSVVGQRAGNQPVLGQGNVMCSAWTEVRRTNTPAAESRTAWVLGFLTAYSQFGQDARSDVSEGKSTDQLVEYVDAYCVKRPQETLQQAATALVGELRGKAH